MCCFHSSHYIFLNSRYIVFFICFCYRITSSFDIGFTFLRAASSTVSSIDGRGTVSMSNMRNANKFSYKSVICKSINLKRVFDIDDKLFGKYFCVSFNENYRDVRNTYLDYYKRHMEDIQCAYGLIITMLILY